MYILAIETTGAFASAAVTDGSRILAHIQGSDRFSHLQNLMPQVQQVIEESGLSIGDIDAIAVSVGPGSFTGIRIGVSSARGLAQILKVPCIPVSSLQALAMREAANRGTLICPMLDARRSQVYAGGYLIEEGSPVEAVKAGPYTLEEFLDAVKEYDSILIMGDAADVYGTRISELRTEGISTAPEDTCYQHADTVALMGAALLAQGEAVIYEELKPDYMRIPEAERKLKEQKAAAGKGGQEK